MLFVMGASLKERIGAMLEERGMSKADLKRATGVSWQTVHSWSTGKYKPRAENLAKLARVFRVSVEELMPEPEAPSGMAASSWEAFLRTPEGQSMTLEEHAILASIDWQEREPTPQALAALLAVVRMTPPATTNR